MASGGGGGLATGAGKPVVRLWAEGTEELKISPRPSDTMQAKNRHRLESCSTAAPSPRPSRSHGCSWTFAEEDLADELPEAEERQHIGSHTAQLSLAEPTTPPSTPRVRRAAVHTPPPAPRSPARPPLLRALYRDNVEKVREALQQEPGAAELPFLEHRVEPPLCCAARLGCSAEIARVLLEHRADVHATDVRGRTALAILGSWPQVQLEDWATRFMPGNMSFALQASVDAQQRHKSAFAEVLLEAGGDPQHLAEASRSSANGVRAARRGQAAQLHEGGDVGAGAPLELLSMGRLGYRLPGLPSPL